MTATVNETETVIPPTQAEVDETLEHIDGLDEDTAATVIQYLTDEVDHLIPLPEEVNFDPKEALRAVARVRPDAVNEAAARLLVVLLIAEAFSL